MTEVKQLVVKVGDAATMLDMQEIQIRRLLRLGILKGAKIGQEWRISIQSIYEAAGLAAPLQGNSQQEAK